MLSFGGPHVTPPPPPPSPLVGAKDAWGEGGHQVVGQTQQHDGAGQPSQHGGVQVVDEPGGGQSGVRLEAGSLATTD